MAGSFTFVSKPGKKISLERSSHPCPKCKHHASVQLMRSERQWIILNKCISSIMRVRYECSKCTWKNDELPYQESYFHDIGVDDKLNSYFHNSSKTSSLESVIY